MEGIRSCSISGDSSSGATSGMVVRSGQGEIAGCRRRFRRLGMCRQILYGPRWRMGGKGHLLFDVLALCLLFFLFLQLKLRDFRLDLRFELIGRTLKFGKCLAYLARDAGQLLRSKEQECQNKQNGCIGKTHSLIIAGNGNCWLFAGPIYKWISGDSALTSGDKVLTYRV